MESEAKLNKTYYDDLSDENQSLKDTRDDLQKSQETQAMNFQIEKEKLKANLKQKEQNQKELKSSLSSLRLDLF